MPSSFLHRFWHEPPVVFPAAAIFHLFLLARGIADLGDTLSYNWLTLLWYAAAFVLSVYCVLLKRWSAIAYIVLTIAGLLLQFVLPVGIFWKDVGATLFPFDVLTCFFVLFFYKRFR
jgi:hypothetical protein